MSRITALIRERDDVMSALGEEREIRDQIAELARDLEHNRDEYREMVATIEHQRQRLLLSERTELAWRIEEARRLVSVANEHVKVPRMPPQHTLDEIRAKHVRLEQLADLIATSEGEVAHSREELENSEQKERALDVRLLGLSSYADNDDSGRDTAHRRLGKLESLRQAPTPQPQDVPPPDALLVRYRSERQSLYALQAGVSRWTARRILWTVLVVLTLGIAHLARKLVQRMRRRQAPEGELERQLTKYAASSLAELDERVADEDRRLAAAQARSEVAQSQASDREKRQAELERELTATLDAVGATTAATVEARGSAYLAACERRAEYVAVALELEQLKNLLVELRRPRQERRVHQAERESLTSELRGFYQREGIGISDLDGAQRALDTLLRRVAEATRANQDAEAAAQTLHTLLSGSSLEGLEAKSREAERSLAEHVARFGTLAAIGGEESPHPRELAELQEQAELTRDRVTKTQTRMAALEDQIGRSTELEERRTELEPKIARLEQAKDAVKIAREVLREAADELNRQFRPHLRDALRTNLPRITGGRYVEVEIDNELRVQVVAPIVARQVAADQLLTRRAIG